MRPLRGGAVLSHGGNVFASKEGEKFLITGVILWAAAIIGLILTMVQMVTTIMPDMLSRAW